MSCYMSFSLPYVALDGSVWAIGECECEPHPRVRRLAFNPAITAFVYWLGADLPTGRRAFEAMQRIAPDIRWATVEDLHLDGIPSGCGRHGEMTFYTAEQVRSALS